MFTGVYVGACVGRCLGVCVYADAHTLPPTHSHIHSMTMCHLALLDASASCTAYSHYHHHGRVALLFDLLFSARCVLQAKAHRPSAFTSLSCRDSSPTTAYAAHILPIYSSPACLLPTIDRSVHIIRDPSTNVYRNSQRAQSSGRCRSTAARGLWQRQESRRSPIDSRSTTIDYGWWRNGGSS